MSAEREFQRLVGALDYPLFIVTAAGDEERDGCLVGFATQCSIHPPLFCVFLSNKNRTFRIAQSAETLAVHFVPKERRDLAELFGGETADETDKLDQVEWRPGQGGAPVVDGLPNWLVGRIEQKIDHVGFVLSPVDAQASADERELGFQDAKDIEPGHEP